MKADKFIKVSYKHVEFPAGELQQKLDYVFDSLFEYIVHGKEGVSASASEAKEGVIGYAKN